MNEMQKRVAVVICERLFGPFDERELDSPSSVSAQSMAAASAVIAAMHEPTDAMERAGEAADSHEIGQMGIQSIYGAMINAALAKDHA